MANNRTIAIPIYLKSGAPGNRKCTSDWKIKPVARYTRQLGGIVDVGIGISTDEWTRVSDSQIAHQKNVYPLIDLEISRTECGNIIRDEGIEPPPKSSCWFCPYKKLSEWSKMAAEDPERFELAAKLEAKLEAKRGVLEKDEVFLTRRLKPLQEAVLPSGQLEIEGIYEPPCGSACWT